MPPVNVKTVTFAVVIGKIVKFPVGALNIPCKREKAVISRPVVPTAAETDPAVLSIAIGGAVPPFEL